MRDFFSGQSRRDLQTDTGFVSINFDGVFKDRGFHLRLSRPTVLQHRGYRACCRAGDRHRGGRVLSLEQ
jgi:hypothetical protein